ncbi:hypothetical protein [Fulvimonas soli]|jgi:hypothetical protein|uniref:hypothetical protein n=1 Tax=Fulvimonas soli TaxID=155197 RepID=UPI00111D1CA7|nr:hypothetical protein [Fulvimonas soli]HVX56387.1 hypothetical protein [Candidatus Saccharimonadales bacterium]
MYKKNTLVDIERLRLHAELLDAAIKSHIGESEDVNFLANLPSLNKCLDEAKKGLIKYPRKLGLGRWMLESDILSVPEVALRLAQFGSLLDGWELSVDQDKDYSSY